MFLSLLPSVLWRHYSARKAFMIMHFYVIFHSLGVFCPSWNYVNTVRKYLVYNVIPNVYLASIIEEINRVITFLYQITHSQIHSPTYTHIHTYILCTYIYMRYIYISHTYVKMFRITFIVFTTTFPKSRFIAHNAFVLPKNDELNHVLFM